jgi:aminoglycoside 3-N-acetyltransferase
MVFCVDADRGPGRYARGLREISGDRVVGQLHALGVATGGVLLVHTSFQAVGPIEGGPLG